MKIVIIGDSCLDVFVYGRVERICPEAPVPVLVAEKTVIEKGMAWNVERNLEAMGVSCTMISYETPISKTRFIHHETDHMLLRVDENDIAPIAFTENDLDKINFQDYNGCIVSDYGKGFLSVEIMQKIFKRCKECEIPSFVDTKARMGEWAFEATFIKMNRMEFQYSFGKNGVIPLTLRENIIVTKGGEGCEYMGILYAPPIKVQVVDLAGAGDVFLANFAKVYIETNNPIQSISMAQYFSGKVVQQRGSTLSRHDYEARII